MSDLPPLPDVHPAFADADLIPDSVYAVQVRDFLTSLYDVLLALQSERFDVQSADAAIRELGEAYALSENEWRQIVLVALTGSTVRGDLAGILPELGKQRVISRIEAAAMRLRREAAL